MSLYPAKNDMLKQAVYSIEKNVTFSPGFCFLLEIPWNTVAGQRSEFAREEGGGF